MRDLLGQLSRGDAMIAKPGQLGSGPERTDSDKEQAERDRWQPTSTIQGSGHHAFPQDWLVVVVVVVVVAAGPIMYMPGVRESRDGDQELGWTGLAKLGMGGDRGDWTKKASLCSGMQQIEVHSNFRARPFSPGVPDDIDYECTECVGDEQMKMPLSPCTPCPVVHETTSLPNT